MKWIILTAIILGFSAFALDAFFAHGLKNFLGANYSDVAQHALTTASRYQLLASLFLLILFLIYRIYPHPCVIASQMFVIIGVVLFCFTVYGKYILQLPQLAKLAPVGGIAFIISFLSLIPLMWIL